MFDFLKRKTVSKKKYDLVCAELDNLRNPRLKKWKVIFRSGKGMGSDTVVEAYDYTTRMNRHNFWDSSDNLISCFPFSDDIVGVKLYKDEDKK